MKNSNEDRYYLTNAQAAAGNYQKGLFLKQLNRYEEAIEYFQKAIDQNPNNITYTIELAVCYLNLNNFTHTLNILGPVYQKNPRNLDIIKTYCSALLETGHTDKAKSILQSVEDHFPTDLALKALWMKAKGTKFPQT